MHIRLSFLYPSCSLNFTKFSYHASWANLRTQSGLCISSHMRARGADELEWLAWYFLMLTHMYTNTHSRKHKGLYICGWIHVWLGGRASGRMMKHRCFYLVEDFTKEPYGVIYCRQNALLFKSFGSVRFCVCLYLKEVSYAHQGCIYLIKDTVKL